MHKRWHGRAGIPEEPEIKWLGSLVEIISIHKPYSKNDHLSRSGGGDGGDGLAGADEGEEAEGEQEHHHGAEA